MTESIPELRHKAWTIAKKYVDYFNKINEILNKDLDNEITIKTIEKEDEHNYQVEYIEYLISLAKENQYDLQKKTEYIDFIFKKHEELKTKLKELRRNSINAGKIKREIVDIFG